MPTSVSQPPSLSRQATVALVAVMTIIGAGIVAKVVKQTPTASISNEYIGEWKSGSGQSVATDGLGNIHASGSIIADGATFGSGTILQKYVSVVLTGSGVATSTGNFLGVGQIEFPFAGKIIGSQIHVGQTANNNKTTVDVKINGVSIFTTKQTIDSGQPDSSNAATPSAINASANTFARNDDISFDVLAPATTPAKNLTLWLRILATTFP